MRLSYLAQDRLDLAETAKQLAKRMSEPRELDFVPLKRAAQNRVGKPEAVLRFRRQKHVDKISVFVDSDFAGDPVSRKSTTGLVAQLGNHTEIWIIASELDSIERCRSGVLWSGDRRSSWTIPEI